MAIAPNCTYAVEFLFNISGLKNEIDADQQYSLRVTLAFDNDDPVLIPVYRRLKHRFGVPEDFVSANFNYPTGSNRGLYLVEMFQEEAAGKPSDTPFLLSNLTYFDREDTNNGKLVANSQLYRSKNTSYRNSFPISHRIKLDEENAGFVLGALDFLVREIPASDLMDWEQYLQYLSSNISIVEEGSRNSVARYLDAIRNHADEIVEFPNGTEPLFNTLSTILNHRMSGRSTLPGETLDRFALSEFERIYEKAPAHNFSSAVRIQHNLWDAREWSNCAEVTRRILETLGTNRRALDEIVGIRSPQGATPYGNAGRIQSLLQRSIECHQMHWISTAQGAREVASEYVLGGVRHFSNHPYWEEALTGFETMYDSAVERSFLAPVEDFCVWKESGEPDFKNHPVTKPDIHRYVHAMQCTRGVPNLRCECLD